MSVPPPWTNRNYSHTYWEYGRRKIKGDASSPDILCFETGYFGLKMNTGPSSADLSSVYFGIFDTDDNSDGNDDNGNKNEVSYVDAITEEGRGRMDDDGILERNDLIVEVTIHGDEDRNERTYQVSDPGKFRPRIWESGKLVQHFEFTNLELWKKGTPKDAKKGMKKWADSVLGCCNTSLYVLVWPDSVTFTVQLDLKENDGEESVWWSKGFTVRMKMNKWSVEKTYRSPGCKVAKEISLPCHVSATSFVKDCGATLEMPDRNMSIHFDAHYNCLAVENHEHTLFKRAFQCNYTDIRDYDELHMRVRLTKSTPNPPEYLPVMLFLQPLANPTGLSPFLCDDKYLPNGVPVQLSKNWHIHKKPSYGRFYFYLPLQPTASTSYRMRIPYGFYGTLPTASHANLSLVGWSNNSHGGRWDQLAIGCWGETYCMDIDMDCVPRTITDIRLLMARDGPQGTCWNWTDAGWGGDWLSVLSRSDQRLLPRAWKTAYISHGPCLTEVCYGGYYGNFKQVRMTATVRTARADDYARTFTDLDYTFQPLSPLPTRRAFFFLMGGANYLVANNVAWGSIEQSSVQERTVPDTIPVGNCFVKQKELEGKGPWFVAFHGQEFRTIKKGPKGRGWRALIIRSYHASFAGKTFDNPSFTLRSEKTNGQGGNTGTNLVCELVPPLGIDSFVTGDRVSFRVEWITIPFHHDSYYGPNSFFKEHLKDNPRSWRTVYREMKSNDLDVTMVAGGRVTNTYPLIIQVSDDTTTDVRFTVKGGVGAVPIRFDGLRSRFNSLFLVEDDGTQVKFEPQVHGNDFWQIHYDPVSMTYNQAFNVPIENYSLSAFILRLETE